MCACVQTTVHVSRLRRRQLIRPGPVNGMRKTHQMAVVVLFTARIIYLDKCTTVKTRLPARVCVREFGRPRGHGAFWPPQQMKFIFARIEFRRMAIKMFVKTVGTCVNKINLVTTVLSLAGEFKSFSLSQWFRYARLDSTVYVY